MSERTAEDALGEALRRMRYGLIRPLWADMDEDSRAPWRKRAAGFALLLADLGFEVRAKGPKA